MTAETFATNPTVPLFMGRDATTSFDESEREELAGDLMPDNPSECFLMLSLQTKSRPPEETRKPADDSTAPSRHPMTFVSYPRVAGRLPLVLPLARHARSYNKGSLVG